MFFGFNSNEYEYVLNFCPPLSNFSGSVPAGGRMLNHAIAVDLKVEGNIQHFTASKAAPMTIFMLKYIRSSMGSESPLYDSRTMIFIFSRIATFSTSAENDLDSTTVFASLTPSS